MLTGILGRDTLGSFLLGAGDESPGVDSTMALVLSYYSMIQLLSAKSLYMAGWTIGLYATNTVITPTDTASKYTASAQRPAFNTYAPQSLGSWSAAFLDSLNVVQVQAPLVVWTPINTLASGPVYGYYILDAMGNWVGAQANPAGPVVVGGTLQPFSVFPIFREQAIA